MDINDKRLGEAALRHLCLGTQVVGARWYAFNFFIEIEPVNAQSQGAIKGDLVLSVESRWTVFPKKPEHFPDVAGLPELPLEERVAMLALLAGQNIVDASLGNHHPHLILTFESGSVFFLNGFDERYECWNLTTVGELNGYKWLIVAVPGGDISLFIPPDFAQVEEV